MSILDIFKQKTITKEEIAELLKVDTETFKKFEESYKLNVLDKIDTDNLFELNAKQVAAEREGINITNVDGLDTLIDRIVSELVASTNIWNYDGSRVTITTPTVLEGTVTKEEILNIPEEIRPELSGSLLKIQCDDNSSIALMDMYNHYLKEKNPIKKKGFYDRFRQGLDILDLDGLTYEIIGTNPNSMGNWLPNIVQANGNFFKIPKTTIIKVPLPLLQLTRLDYQLLTPTTIEIVDKYCKKVFNLDTEKEYFIKTGTYSSKFDFRNAYVHDAKEVNELGEYLLFIHFQALCMAHYDLSGRNQPIIYGVSTTNEWVVREYIKDVENNPCIYKGLPLHTEYRVFVDFDTKKVIGISPYWRSDVMKQRFGKASDSDSPHNIHDYIIYTSHEETLYKRYNDNKDIIIKEIQKLINDCEGFYGQWSIDIMQNGNDFYIIDMALAQNSALYDCVPEELKKPLIEDWLPKLEKLHP